jgi:hypothetical protein
MDPGAEEITSTTERQGHGKAFEDWVVETFLEERKIPSHTDKWDAEGATFKEEFKEHTGFYNGLPISIKTCKFNQSVNFGDAIRQFENNQDFLLIVGFWKQAGNSKKIVQVVAKKVGSEEWHNLFVDFETEKEKGPEHCKKRTRDKIQELDKTIKTTEGYKEARKKARTEKAEIKSRMTLNPKIDSKKQRRLQCSLPKPVFFEFTGVAPSENSSATLWGKPVPMITK